MKKAILLIGAAILLSTQQSCKHDSNTTVSPTTNNSINSGTNSTTVSGKWTVSYFYDNDKDETSDYATLVFEFNADKTLSITSGAGNVSGTWNETTDDGLQKLVINIATSDKKLLELNDDWQIVSKTETEIKLKDDNPSKKEELHFKRM